MHQPPRQSLPVNLLPDFLRSLRRREVNRDDHAGNGVLLDAKHRQEETVDDILDSLDSR